MSGPEKPDPAPSDNATGMNEGDVSTFARPDEHDHVAQDARAGSLPEALPPEKGGQAGPEPTRYGDWERKGRCTDF